MTWKQDARDIAGGILDMASWCCIWYGIYLVSKIRDDPASGYFATYQAGWEDGYAHGKEHAEHTLIRDHDDH